MTITAAFTYISVGTLTYDLQTVCRKLSKYPLKEASQELFQGFKQGCPLYYTHRHFDQLGFKLENTYYFDQCLPLVVLFRVPRLGNLLLFWNTVRQAAGVGG